MPLQNILWSKGWSVVIGPGWVVTSLPDGSQVHAHPEGSPEQAMTAEELGYGADLEAMTRDHDPLHLAICAMLGLPGSYALTRAAGHPADPRLAALEETAVLAVQRFMRASGGRVPTPPKNGDRP